MNEVYYPECLSVRRLDMIITKLVGYDMYQTVLRLQKHLLTNILQVTILFIIKKLKGNDKEEYMTTAARESAAS